jgi:hypothetical protein
MKIALFAVTLCLASRLIFAQDETGTSGRFQIVFGTAQTLLSGAPSGVKSSGNSPVVIRIDTSTGKTWELVRLYVDGEYKEFWKEISERNPNPK